MNKHVFNQLISLSSAIDRLDYAITSADQDHIQLWSNIIQWRFEGLTVLLLGNAKQINNETLRQLQRESLPQIFRVNHHETIV